ncbi:MAG: hypothetical protein J5944_08005 [Lentisphaeria bacterium]|nr:hypothetical protein [Lentisphaeria bacterium]
MDPADYKQKIRLFTFASAALLAAAGIFLRCQGLDRFLEYDEIWTFRFYVPLSWHEIFTDLATPNNHCLNSLLIKWLYALFPASAALLRLPALVAGILTVVLVLLAVWKTARRSGAVIMAAFWIAFQADLIHYSRTARGYSLQCLFVLAFFLLLIRPVRISGSWWKTALLLLVCASGACLSVTSGLIFVGAAGAAWLLCFAFSRRKKNGPAFPVVSEKGSWKAVAAAGGVFLILAGLWYGSQYAKLKQGQQFGTELTGISDFLRFCGSTLRNLHVLPLLCLTAAGLFVRKRNPFRFLFSFSLIFCGLVLLSALATKAGPLRVYLPLYAPLTVSGTLALTVLCRAIRRTRWILPAGLLVSLFPLAVFPEDMEKTEPPGSEHIAAKVMAETPGDVVILYRRGDELPVFFNCPEAAPDMRDRLRNPAGLSGLLVMGRNDVLEVFDAYGRNADVPLKGFAWEELPPKSGIPLSLFKLESLRGNVDLSSSGPLLMNVQSHARCETVLRRGEWLRFSAALTAGFRADEQDRAGLYLCEKPFLTAPECLALEERTGGRIRFYRFRKTSEAGGSEP